MSENRTDLHVLHVTRWLQKILRAQTVRHRAVDRRVRRTDHQRRNVLELLTCPQAPENLESVHLREVQVQQDKMGAHCAQILFGCRDNVEGLLAIHRNAQFQGQFFLTDRLSYQQGVGEIILDQEQIPLLLPRGPGLVEAG